MHTYIDLLSTSSIVSSICIRCVLFVFVQVKGSIKLRFKNRAGQDMVVVRSLMLTQKKGSSTFKTLDGVIKSTDPRTGNRTSTWPPPNRLGMILSTYRLV